jgi:hypothetical protein
MLASYKIVHWLKKIFYKSITLTSGKLKRNFSGYLCRKPDKSAKVNSELSPGLFPVWDG